MADAESLEAQLAVLEASLGQSVGMVAAFDGELGRLRETMAFTGREVGALSSGIGGGLRRAMDGLVLDGMKLSDALRGLAKSMLDSAYSVAARPIQQGMGDLLARGMEAVVNGVMPFGNGAGFSQGRVMPFASGGVVSGPVTFPMRGGMGLMGEAGAEAIMPLARGSDGRLGVRAAGGGRPVTVVMNIQTPDVQGFQRSQSQIAAQAARAMARGQRNR